MRHVWKMKYYASKAADYIRGWKQEQKVILEEKSYQKFKKSYERWLR